jgi:outer membrane protein assembly factor BamB
MRDEEEVSRAGGGVAWLAWWGLVLAAACGGDPESASDASSDDSGDALRVAPGSLPADPKGGELAWVVSAPGAEGPMSVAVDPQGNIFVVATQTGAVSLDSVYVPPPTSGNGLLALKLSPGGKPIWGRSIMSAPTIHARSMAVTPAGAVVIGGSLKTGPSYGDEDGFVIALDGEDGATRWSKALASSWEDRVAGIAVGPDVDAHGTTLNGTTFDGDVLGPVDVSHAYRLTGPNTIRF